MMGDQPVFNQSQAQKAIDHGWLRLPPISIGPVHIHITGDPDFQQKVLNHFSAQHAQGVQIMSQISDFAARTQANVDKLQGDLTAIAAFIQTLQNSPGPISAEDQATLDALEQRVATVTGNADKLVPPVTPPAP